MLLPLPVVGLHHGLLDLLVPDLGVLHFRQPLDLLLDLDWLLVPLVPDHGPVDLPAGVHRLPGGQHDDLLHRLPDLHKTSGRGGSHHMLSIHPRGNCLPGYGLNRACVYGPAWCALHGYLVGRVI